MEQKNEQKVFCSREWDPILLRVTYKYNGIGELAFCKSNHLEHFTKGKIYKIEKIGEKKYNRGKAKFVGIPGYYGFGDFDFVENNPAMFRDVRINELMDIDFCEVKKNTERKIHTLPFKNRVLAQAMLSSVMKKIGEKGDEYPVKNLSFDDIAEHCTNGSYSKYQIVKEDFDELANISVKDFIDTFILQNNC